MEACPFYNDCPERINLTTNVVWSDIFEVMEVAKSKLNETCEGEYHPCKIFINRAKKAGFSLEEIFPPTHLTG